MYAGGVFAVSLAATQDFLDNPSIVPCTPSPPPMNPHGGGGAAQAPPLPLTAAWLAARPAPAAASHRPTPWHYSLSPERQAGWGQGSCAACRHV